MIQVSNMPNAYREVFEILKYVDIKDVNQIPKELVSSIKDKMNKKYDFKFNPNEEFENQNILRETKAILSYIFLNYWANEEQKCKIEELFRKDLIKKEKEKNEVFSSDKLFKVSEEKIEHKRDEKNELTIVKQKWYKKFLKKIKKIFMRK